MDKRGKIVPWLFSVHPECTQCEMQLVEAMSKRYQNDNDLAIVSTSLRYPLPHWASSHPPPRTRPTWPTRPDVLRLVLSDTQGDTA